MTVTQLRYEFLGLLPASESLAVRGRRLQETALERQSKVYAPDVFPKVQIQACNRRIDAAFTDDISPILAHGEIVTMNIRLENVGAKDVGEIWLIHALEDELWQGKHAERLGGFAYICYQKAYLTVF